MRCPLTLYPHRYSLAGGRLPKTLHGRPDGHAHPLIPSIPHTPVHTTNGFYSVRTSLQLFQFRVEVDPNPTNNSSGDLPRPAGRHPWCRRPRGRQRCAVLPRCWRKGCSRLFSSVSTPLHTGSRDRRRGVQETGGGMGPVLMRAAITSHRGAGSRLAPRCASSPSGTSGKLRRSHIRGVAPPRIRARLHTHTTNSGSPFPWLAATYRHGHLQPATAPPPPPPPPPTHTRIHTAHPLTKSLCPVPCHYAHIAATTRTTWSTTARTCRGARQGW